MRTTEFLEIIAAAQDGRHKVKGLAYSGGKMRLFGWSRPVVVDMAGLAVAGQIPLLTNHVNDTLCRVGVVTAKVADEGLVIEGEIVADGTEAENIVTQGKAGADWRGQVRPCGRRRGLHGHARQRPSRAGPVSHDPKGSRRPPAVAVRSPRGRRDVQP